MFFQGRFIFNEENEIVRAKQMGINDLQKIHLNEIISGDPIFSLLELQMVTWLKELS